jgi:hypothetical protein
MEQQLRMVPNLSPYFIRYCEESRDNRPHVLVKESDQKLRKLYFPQCQ